LGCLCHASPEPAAHTCGRPVPPQHRSLGKKKHNFHFGFGLKKKQQQNSAIIEPTQGCRSAHAALPKPAARSPETVRRNSQNHFFHLLVSFRTAAYFKVKVQMKT